MSRLMTERRFAAMGTRVHVIAVDGPPDLTFVAGERIDELERRWSRFRADSELNEVNDAAGSDVEVSHDTWVLVSKACQAWRLSQGAFDPTVGPLVDLWGFGPDPAQDRAPAEASRREALALVGMDQVSTDAREGTLTKAKAGLRMDFSAVAKGYGADQVGRALERRGVTDFMVEVGGEIVVRGERPGGGPWRLIVEDPSGNGAPIRLLLRDSALATSGDYRNWRRLADGSEISHTLDPRTGFPVKSKLAAASVIAPTCAVAETLA